MTTPKAMIAAWLPLFFRPDDVFEVRVLDADGRRGQVVAGYLTARDIQRLAGTIAHVSEGSYGAYFTPHVVNPACLARSPGRLLEVNRSNGVLTPKLTEDKDVTACRYLLIDVDPVRAAGHAGDSATDAEREAAGGVADAVLLLLRRHGYADPLTVDSGNGRHLYYQLDSTPDRLALTLRALSSHLDTTEAKIDRTVFNASRIMKIPGTVARKGVATTDRPHRLCQVLGVPSGWTV